MVAGLKGRPWTTFIATSLLCDLGMHYTTHVLYFVSTCLNSTQAHLKFLRWVPTFYRTQLDPCVRAFVIEFLSSGCAVAVDPIYVSERYLSWLYFGPQ